MNTFSTSSSELSKYLITNCYSNKLTNYIILFGWVENPKSYYYFITPNPIARNGDMSSIKECYQYITDRQSINI